MNLKKYLRQQIEKDAESLLTESDRQFCMQLAKSVQQNPVQIKRKKFKLTAITSAVTAVIIAVVLGVTLPLVLNKQPPVDEIHYKEENALQTVCTIEDVNNNSNYFQINETENVLVQSYLKYDSVSEDKLFYSVKITADISEFTFIIVVNENYNYEEFNWNYDFQIEELTYDLNYFKKPTDREGAQYTGYVQINSETVFINYTQQLFDMGKQVFFDEIQSVLKVKE